MIPFAFIYLTTAYNHYIYLARRAPNDIIARVFFRIEQQRSFLKRADNTLSRVDDLIQEKEAVFAKNIRPEKAADWLEARDEPEAITYAIYPVCIMLIECIGKNGYIIY